MPTEKTQRDEFAIRPDIATVNRAADDAGMPIENCSRCGLPLNADSTHRTYEEHDKCRNQNAMLEARKTPKEKGSD